jgi:hypothetical protein
MHYTMKRNLPIFTAHSDMCKVKVKLSMLKHLAMTWGSGGIAPWILNVGTRWRRVSSFTPQGTWDPRPSLDTVRREVSARLGIKPRFSSHTAHSLII